MGESLLWLCAGTLKTVWCLKWLSWTFVFLQLWQLSCIPTFSRISQIPHKCSINITLMFMMCEHVCADVQVKFPCRIRVNHCITDQPFSARHVRRCLWCQYIFISSTVGWLVVVVVVGGWRWFAYKASSLFLDWVWKESLSSLVRSVYLSCWVEIWRDVWQRLEVKNGNNSGSGLVLKTVVLYAQIGAECLTVT